MCLKRWLSFLQSLKSHFYLINTVMRVEIWNDISFLEINFYGAIIQWCDSSSCLPYSCKGITILWLWEGDFYFKKEPNIDTLETVLLNVAQNSSSHKKHLLLACWHWTKLDIYCEHSTAKTWNPHYSRPNSTLSKSAATQLCLLMVAERYFFLFLHIARHRRSVVQCDVKLSNWLQAAAVVAGGNRRNSQGC